MKNNFNLLLGIIATFLLFISCDKDFYEDVELQKNNLESIDVKTITYDEFKRKLKSLENKPAVKMIINNTNSTNHYARSEDDSDIEIFTDVIKEITSGTYKSYTMYIKTSDTIASKFYNLTLEEKEGNTAAFITKYSPTENWLNDKNQPFEGDIRTFRVIEPGPGGSIKFTHIDENVAGGSSYPFDCDGYVQTSIVLEPYQCGCGPEHWPWQTCECTNSHPGYTPNLYYECIPNNFGNPGTGNPGSGYSPGGSSPGSSQPGEPSNNSLTTIVGVPDMPRVSYLTEPLSLDARQNDYLVDNPDVEYQLGSYIDQNTINDVIDPAAMAFAQELIDLARFEPNQADVPNLVSLSIITKNHGLDNSLNNDYINQIDPYVDLDLSSLSEENHELILIKLQVKYQVLKALNPTWSEGTLVWETLKEAIHMGLDVLGLVPLLGEPADLLNGVLYSLDGDTLNASLSFASALPIVGYGSTATKFGLKAKNYYNAATNIASKEVLVWKITSNIISFGDRAQLRNVLGLGSFASNGLHAHHLIPWDFRNWSIIQKAAKSGDAWHMNDIINGIPLPSTNHLTGHNLYNNKIGQKLTQLNAISNTPQEAYVNLVNFTNQVKTLIQNNPNMNLGQIANLIN
ncbi:AHH domain-containing protein [Flavobacterium azooxidireducens]|uniref:AHH domain-containing protein n=1 Tax=Flavobacterium azooxidireducens TaxID=1871076 RepID=A0ABY4KGZ6_9FLAO|nr:AHH domain-containing protein [Flavobacterium azooxidireducens]UPQ80072.1 AHH domain-containing protein [Flavobacterium azooxidireducens]